MSMSRKLAPGWIVAIVVAIVIIADQALKIWVKTHFYLGESLQICSFFELRFVQNNGMAFGMEFGSKLLLTLFRIVVVALLTWYIVKLCRRRTAPAGYLVTLSLIAAGAFGNIIDCVAYGEIFTNPLPPSVAAFTSWGDGYGALFHGLVVDMLYFPLFSFTWSESIPLVGGSTWSFFDPVFNIADAAITVGIAVLVLFYTKYLPFADNDKSADA